MTIFRIDGLDLEGLALVPHPLQLKNSRWEDSSLGVHNITSPETALVMYAGTEMRIAYQMILKQIPYGEIGEFLADDAGAMGVVLAIAEESRAQQPRSAIGQQPSESP